jgi:hypothetical protein
MPWLASSITKSIYKLYHPAPRNREQLLLRGSVVKPELVFMLRLYARTRGITMAKLTMGCIERGFRLLLEEEGSPLAKFVGQMPPRGALMAEHKQIYDELYGELLDRERLTNLKEQSTVKG